MTIAALFVDPKGAYAGLPDVDLWDEARDARRYDGPHPVISHPPCQRWGKLWAGQPLWIKRTGIRKIKGDDGGCFAHSLYCVRKYGGIIEHPWGSHAWPHFGLNTPPGKVAGSRPISRVAGRAASSRAATVTMPASRRCCWPMACELPELDWGIGEPRLDPAVVERMGLKRAKRLGEVGARGGGTDSAPRIGTPIEFRDLLLGIARTAQPKRIAA
jgi:hypothetical protein